MKTASTPDADETSEALARLIQASIVKSWSSKLPGLPNSTPSPFPSKLNASPALPAPNIVFPASAPELPSAPSKAFPSARHQLTKPGGAGTQLVTVETVNKALELVTEPTALVTRTA